MKKILLGLGILPLLTLPVIGLVSCGGSSDGGTTPDPDTSTDLKITAIPSTQTVIDKAITDFSATEATDANKITALLTVFAGVTEANFKNFETKATPSAGTTPGIITLTAKTGFAFGSSSSLTSKLVGGTTLDEEVAKFATPVETKTPTTSSTDAIKSINDAPDSAAKLAALKVLANVPTLSDGFTFDVKSAIVNTTTNTSIDVSIVVLQEVGSNARNVTLRVTGLAPATINIKIVARPSTQAKIDEAITAYNGAASDNVEAKKAALRLVFNGTDRVFDNFTVQATATSGTTPGTIVLTAKPGFTINGEKSLSSSLAPIVHLDITAKSSTQAKIDEAIKLYKAAGTDKAKQLVALTLIFQGPGLTGPNLENLDVTTPTTTPPTMVLTAKPGFTINREQSLSSSLAPIVHLNITAKLSTQDQIDEAITRYKVSGTDKAAQLSALALIFEGSGLTEPNLENLDVLATPGIPGTIVLTAKSGFTINGKPNLSSWIEVNLDITPTPSNQPKIDEAVTAYNGAGTDKAKQLAALKLIFTGPGLTEQNLSHIHVIATATVPGGAPGTIRLIASYGSSFNGEKNLTSVLAFKTLDQEVDKFKATATKVKTY